MPSLSFVPTACATSSKSSRISLPLTCEPRGTAAAFLLTDDLAVTAHHCVRAAREIFVSDREATPRVINSSADLAILHLSTPLPHVRIPSLGKLPPIGHVCEIQSPYSHQPSEIARLHKVGFEVLMSAGGRIPLLELIPEHGRVGRGWSGAPVLSTQGVVIGVFVQLRDGVAHAVPIEFVLRMEEGEDVPFAYLPGVATQPLTSRYTRKAARIGGNTSGVRVAKVKRDTALQVGDVIVEVNGKPVSNSGTIAWGFAQASWQAAVSTETPGKNIPVRVLREGELQTVKVVVRDSRLATGATAWADNRAVMAGKMIFATLSFELLRRWGDEWPRDAPEDLVRVGMEDMGEAKDVVVLMGEVKGLKQVYGREDRKCGECEEREDVQVHENWEELHFLRVTRVDEKPVRQLEDLAQESKRGEDIVIEFENGFVAQVLNGELVESTMQDGKDEFEVVRTDGKI